MLPFLVQIFPNEESTNIIPVPWMLASSRPVSRNRSSSPLVGRVSDAGRLRDVAASSAAGVRKPPKEMLWGGGEDIASILA
jgi:hypothetical protein